MKKLVLLFILFGLDTQKEQQIVWSSQNKLTWENFKGDVDVNEKNVAALTNCDLIARIISSEKDFAEIEIKVLFNESKSFVRTKSDYVLNHEQVHFDIFELAARKLRERIQSEHYSNLLELDSILKMEKQTIWNNCDSVQESYDSETNHSNNKVSQEFWNIKIQSKLNSTKQFENVNFQVSCDDCSKETKYRIQVMKGVY